MKKQLYLIVILFITFLAGCNRDEIIGPNGTVFVNRGAYILCEGGFAPNTSALSFFDVEQDTFYTNIFGPGALGTSPDGLIYTGTNLYITEQGSFGGAGKIYRNDTNGVEINSQVFGTNPYSLTLANNKIYATNGPAGNVSVLDKDNFSTITTIAVGLFPQEILSVGSKVFVCNTTDFVNSDSTVSVIDAATDLVVASINVQAYPSSVALSRDGKLLIGCDGSAGTYIYKVDPDTYAKLDSFSLTGGFNRDIAVDFNSNLIYYISGFSNNRIMKYDLVTRTETEFAPASGVTFYGLNYDNANNKIYAAVAPDFTSNGNLRIYNTGGTIDQQFTTGGVAPRRIVFKQ